MPRNHIPRLLIAALLAPLSFGCRHDPETLAALCAGRETAQRIDVTIDTVMPSAGPALGVLKGRAFAIQLRFVPGPATGAAAGTGGASGCDGKMGAATFSGDVPEPLRNATDAGGAATWRVEGDVAFLDLNPKSRDNNLLLVLPLSGAAGHWGLSTFAGEVARGRTAGGKR